jgi:hypothetical protein
MWVNFLAYGADAGESNHAELSQEAFGPRHQTVFP